ncbi:F-box protein PP2-B10-like [Lycium ferocissimum]|uniref:F-box protein PP2-B10-like n=1 Tax=Lycium ferocissimum TaxID=112874 RepID=UPI002815E5AF|nr:F-box protein PP2-B10-like [Lycium ferocissimum]
MEYFLSLPKDCISEIFSLTSPKDAARSSIVSQGFKSIVESDVVWENFLPCDYQHIINISESFLVYSSKKELYLSLCNTPILLDGSKLSFSLDKKTGKKFFMVAPKELVFSWDHTSRYWGLSYYPESRFSEVAYFPGFRWLDIRGTIASQMLSKRTAYAVYLVFKLTPDAFDGLEIGNSVVRFVNHEAEERQKVRRIGFFSAQRRADEWMEIEMGKFFNGVGEDGDVEARLMEIRRRFGIGGLLVHGVEFRPE